MARLSALLVLAFTLSAFSQQQPTPTAQPTPAPTLRTAVKLVVVDVIVTDKDQKAIHGLKVEDFALLENNTSQGLRAFEEHTGAALSSVPPKMPDLPPGVFTSYQPIPHDSTLNIILLDRLNTPTDAQLYMQHQINDYLKSAKHGSLTAVFGLTTRLTLLQGFTDDPALVRAAVNGKSANPSSMLADPTNRGDTTRVSDQVGEAVYDITGSEQAALAAEASSLMRLFEDEQVSFQTQTRVKYTLDALNELARYLNNFSGRKNLIWFSGSFPVNILPDMKTPEETLSTAASNITPGAPFIGVASDEKEFRQTTALLSRDQVAVYPILAQGLESDTNFTASSSDSTGTKVRGGPGQYMKDLNTFSQGVFDAHSTMNEMAQQTGGRTFLNTNDLAGSIDAAVKNGADYYTIAYSPTDANWNGNYRHIEVRLKEKGYNVAYRRGYFAEDTDAASAHSASTGNTANSTSSAMRTALLHGGPSIGQLIFTVRAVPNSASDDNLVAAGNNINKDLKGPFRRLNVDAAIDPRQMAFTQLPDGRLHDSVEYLVFLYDSDGKLMNTAGSTSNVNLKISLEDVVHRGGLPLHTQITVPAKGEYYLRVAIHDIQGDKVGALETPVFPLLKLPPAPVEQSSSGSPAP